jgi:uncharacterized membrane protein YqjE
LLLLLLLLLFILKLLIIILLAPYYRTGAAIAMHTLMIAVLHTNDSGVAFWVWAIGGADADRLRGN